MHIIQIIYNIKSLSADRPPCIAVQNTVHGMLYWKCCATNTVLKHCTGKIVWEHVVEELLYRKVLNKKILYKERLYRQMLYKRYTGKESSGEGCTGKACTGK